MSLNSETGVSSFIPSSMLERMYVQGSFRNIDSDEDGVPDAFSFEIVNRLSTVTLDAPVTITVDGEEVLPENLLLRAGELEVRSVDISREKPLKVRVGDILRVMAFGAGGLTEGRHVFELGLGVKRLGRLNVKMAIDTP